MASLRRLCAVGVSVLIVAAVASEIAGSQQPPAPLPAPTERQAPANAPAPAGNESSSKSKHSHAYDFLIRGTVFTPTALGFPGVRLRVRRSTEKKFRWETYTNSRGEFAVRVPQGLEYELVISMKGFTDQTRTVDARSGISEDSVVFRMEPAGGKK